MEGQEGTQQRQLILGHKLFLLKDPDVQDIEKVRLKEEVLAAIKADEMAPLFESLVAESLLEKDQSALDSMRSKNEEELKKLDEKISDAEENLGESEVREAHLAKALFFIRIADKEKALEQLKVTESKTVAVGQKMDLVFHTLQIGFLYMDFDLIAKSIDKAKRLFEGGGDVERKNRLKVYEGLYCMSTRILKKVPAFSGFPAYPYGVQMMPILHPALVSGLPQNQQPMNNGAGIYAVPVQPFMGPLAGFSPNTLVPLTFSIPTRQNSDAGSGVSQEHGGQQQNQQPVAPQRQVVVRRFQIAFQLDLLLILKLAAVILLFNQDGSRQRLVVLVFFASLIYLYQTGALTPIVRWLSQSMQRAAAPPRPPRPDNRAENAPGGGRQNENVPLADEHAGAGNGNRLVEDRNQDENVAEHGGNAGNHWWGFVREIQMIVFGFITSLLPGFHNVD